MIFAALSPRRNHKASQKTLLRLCCDIAGWWFIFFLLGASVLPAHCTAATLTSAFIVALTWPLSLSAWCLQIDASLQCERAFCPHLLDAIDLFTVVPHVTNEENVKAYSEPQTKRDLEQWADTSVVVKSKDEPQSSTQTTGKTESMRLTPEAARCFVLAAVLLCGSLFGQLDWQVPYQVWPYPSLTAYLAARAMYAFLDLKSVVFA